MNTQIIRTFLIAVLLATTTAAMSVTAFAACDSDDPIFQKSIVTYYEQPDYLDLFGFDSRCTYVANKLGPRVCRIRLRGILFRPPDCAYRAGTGKFPVIVVNHGSERLFPANRDSTGKLKFEAIANYFVKKGYIVFGPFRRGHGDEISSTDRSTGVYITDLMDDYENGTGKYIHNTNCAPSNRSCYRAQLLDEQADAEIRYAMQWLKQRTDVKTDLDNPQNHRIAIMGNSYGGAVSVFANSRPLGHKAIAAFSPGAQQWDKDQNCFPPWNPTRGTDTQRALVSAAGAAQGPAYYLQGQWDYDTRAATDLAYAHAYMSRFQKHSRPWRAAIFAFRRPTECGDDVDFPGSCDPDVDFQEIHEEFFTATAVWGASVMDFLKRADVK